MVMPDYIMEFITQIISNIIRLHIEVNKFLSLCECLFGSFGKLENI
jgi:hypothetical protein